MMEEKMLPVPNEGHRRRQKQRRRRFPWGSIATVILVVAVCVYAFTLGQFTRNYTQTVKRAADNKRRYAPGWVHSTCLLRGFPKGGSAPFGTRLCGAKCSVLYALSALP